MHSCLTQGDSIVIPLEQGLRRNYAIVILAILVDSIVIPLEQGLRLVPLMVIFSPSKILLSFH